MTSAAEKATEPASRTWEEVAAAQAGVLARRQALVHGLTKEAWDWRLRHDWQGPTPGVAVLHKGPIVPRQLRWIAVLRAGRGARLGGDGVLLDYGLKHLDVNVLHVVVPPGRTPSNARFGGVTMRPKRIQVPEKWQETKHGLPVVNLHVAALQAAAWAPSDRAAELRLLMVVQQRMSAPVRLAGALTELPQLPRHGLIARVLDEARLGVTAMTELDYVRMCRRHGLPLPDEMQVRVRAGDGMRVLDARYRKQKVCLELDGAQHLWPSNAADDNIRSLEILVSAEPGERIVRLSGFNLRHNESKIVPLLRKLLL